MKRRGPRALNSTGGTDRSEKPRADHLLQQQKSTIGTLSKESDAAIPNSFRILSTVQGRTQSLHNRGTIVGFSRPGTETKAENINSRPIAPNCGRCISECAQTVVPLRGTSDRVRRQGISNSPSFPSTRIGRSTIQELIGHASHVMASSTLLLAMSRCHRVEPPPAYPGVAAPSRVHARRLST